jgi:hypothetical protein
VGVGPKYEPFREASRSLLDEWVPNGVENYQSWWGAGICGVVHEDDGTNRGHVETWGKDKRGLGVNWPVDLATLRASAISLLVYCEAHDAE